ncbi:MAG: hypothetical protein AAF289_05960 [Cyanobacteria bacterium P01_A01_bin.135]
MSSRYKSRLLTFLSERSLKLKDQAQRRLRQAQLAALWSAQVVLYPFYAAFQSTRIIGRQLGRSAQRAFPRLAGRAGNPAASRPVAAPQTPPASDSPIRRTLRSLELFALPLPVAAIGSTPKPVPLIRQSSGVLAQAKPNALPADSAVAPNTLGAAPDTPKAIAKKTASSTPASQSPAQVRGIACLLSGQRLVLIDQGNSIHDVLTPAQADYLQQRLVLELAKFWQAHKQRQMAQRSVTPLPLPRDRRNMLPAVRLWQRTMAWMQTSPVALSIDLFQESRLPERLLHSLPDPQPRASSPLPPASQPLPTQALSPKVPVPVASQSWWVRLLPGWLRPNPATDTGSAEDPTPAWIDPDHQGDDQGWYSANQLAQTRQTQLPPARPSLPAPQRQWWFGLWPWGAADDPSPPESATLVPRESDSLEAKSPEEANLIEAGSPPAYSASASLLDDIEQYLRHLQRAGLSDPSLSKEPTSQTLGDLASGHSLGLGDRSVGALYSDSYQEMPDHPSVDAAIAPAGSASANNLQTTWIEAQVTPLGYERHPLETILGWVDQGLSWIETRLIKFLKWVTPP